MKPDKKSTNHVVYYLTLFLQNRESFTIEELEDLVEKLKRNEKNSSKILERQAIGYLISLVNNKISTRKDEL